MAANQISSWMAANQNERYLEPFLRVRHDPDSLCPRKVIGAAGSTRALDVVW